jgi:hypothetical protein
MMTDDSHSKTRKLPAPKVLGVLTNSIIKRLSFALELFSAVITCYVAVRSFLSIATIRMTPAASTLRVTLSIWRYIVDNIISATFRIQTESRQIIEP